MLACGPHQQFLAGDLAHRHGVGDEQHGGGAVLADQRLDQVQAGLELAQRDIDVARVDGDEGAGRAGQLDALGRLDGLGVPQRIAELGHQRHALHRRVLRLGLEGGRRFDRIAHLQLRRLFGHLYPRLVGEGPLHHPTRLAVPAVPQVGQGVGQALALVLPLGHHPVQVLLPLEELQRLLDAVHTHVHAAVGLHHVATVVAARRLQAHLGHLVAGEAAVGQQEKRLPRHRRVAAGLDAVVGLGGQRQQRSQQGRGGETQQVHGRAHRLRKCSR